MLSFCVYSAISDCRLFLVDGYLPGDMFGNLPFYGGLSLVYAIVGIIWMVICVIYK